MRSRPVSRFELARREDPTASDFGLVSRIVSDLLDEAEVTEPPVDLELVASLLDISAVIIDPGLSVAACLSTERGCHVIRVRASDPPGRQRFSISHELVHALMPGFALSTQYRCAPTVLIDSDDHLERLCDHGASEILMPRRFCDGHVATLATAFSLDSVLAIADRFEASIAATARRVLQDLPEPAALLTFEEAKAPSQVGTRAARKLRLQTCATFGRWPYFRRHKSVAPTSAFARAANGETIHGEEIHMTDITAQAVVAEVHAMPYGTTAALGQRVLAIVRRPGEFR